MNDRKRLNNCISCIMEDKEFYVNNDYMGFYSIHCITSCVSGIVPNHIPKEQVIPFIKLYIKKHDSMLEYL